METWGTSFSPDGQLLAATTKEGIKLWRTSDRKLVRVLHSDTDKSLFFKLSFSADGQMLVAPSIDNTVKVWNTKDGRLLTTLKGHLNVVCDAKFSTDGQLIATVSADQTIKIWTRDGQLLRTLEGHGTTVNSLALSSDNQLLLSTDNNGDMKFWNLSLVERQALDLTQLIQRGCARIQDYLKSNPDVQEETRCLCS